MGLPHGSGCRCFVSAVGLLAASLLNGCRSSPPITVAPASHLSSRTSPQALTTIESVQRMPLYRQAEKACAQKQFQQAAELVQRLSTTPGLSSEQRAFCREQEQICLRRAADSVNAVNSVNTGNSGNSVNSVNPGKERHLPNPPNLPNLPNTERHLPNPPNPPNPPTPQHLNTSTPSVPADCGPRALLLVCQTLHVPASLPIVTKAAGTTGQGTSLAGLQKAAQSVGLKAEGVQVSREALPDVATPAIAWVHGNHFVAVLHFSGRGEQGTVTIHDPNRAQTETIAQEQLLQQCGGYLLLVRK